MAIIDEVRAADPASFAWKPPPYEYEHERDPIELIAGSKSFREAIDRGDRAERIAAGWQESVAAFRSLRQAYLLYD